MDCYYHRISQHPVGIGATNSLIADPDDSRVGIYFVAGAFGGPAFKLFTDNNPNGVPWAAINLPGFGRITLWCSDYGVLIKQAIYMTNFGGVYAYGYEILLNNGA